MWPKKLNSFTGHKWYLAAKISCSAQHAFISRQSEIIGNENRETRKGFSCQVKKAHAEQYTIDAIGNIKHDFCHIWQIAYRIDSVSEADKTQADAKLTCWRTRGMQLMDCYLNSCKFGWMCILLQYYADRWLVGWSVNRMDIWTNGWVNK